MKSSEIAIEIAIEISPFDELRRARRMRCGVKRMPSCGETRWRRCCWKRSSSKSRSAEAKLCWSAAGCWKIWKTREEFENVEKHVEKHVEEWCEDFYKISIIAMIAIILSTCLILLLLNVLGLYTLPLSSIEPHSCIFNLPTLGEIWKSRSNKAPQPCLKVCVPQDSR